MLLNEDTQNGSVGYIARTADWTDGNMYVSAMIVWCLMPLD